MPNELWLRWNLDPGLLIALTLMAFLMRRSPSGLLGVAALAVAFVSPLCALSAALFSARVVHHVLIMAVAAPLLALVRPARKESSPGPALVMFTIVLWAWHWPVAYDFALGWVPAYWLMQATLLVAAVVFWRRVLHPQQAEGSALLAILGAWMQMALLGALLTFAPETLYAIHATAPLAWSLSPLADQQLGGLLMWVPAGLPFLVWGVLVARRGWRTLSERPA
ncbi:cytochrome c oxidase assembly protein [Rubellimicrobium roseum]|uniref:cytochrome c oxidase assembly protein n=1 Tax=Rubellimicrobium roseum TaxID=687525 RepID=UPI001FE7D25F|nr:cytochrome c oxidase assembly protein [Rubellimicrobium roseum]